VDTIFEFVRKFDTEIKKSGADTVLFMAWPYEDSVADQLFPVKPMTIEEIAPAHRDIATELGVEVAPVGLAWQRAMETRPLRSAGRHWKSAVFLTGCSLVPYPTNPYLSPSTSSGTERFSPQKS